MAKKKFLMILNDMAWFWSHRLPLARGIQQGGWDLYLAAAESSADPRVREMGVTPVDLPGQSRSINPLGHLKICYGIYKAINSVKPDMIHAITIRYAFYTGLVTRFMKYGPVTFTIAGLGTFLTAQTPRAKIIRLIMVPLLKLAFARENIHIIFQNDDDRAAMLSAGVVRKDQTSVIRGSGVDLAEFPFTDEPQTQEPIVLFVSRLLKEKGIGEFVEAAALLKQKGVRARFQVAGNVYPDHPSGITREQMEEWAASGAIDWLGLVGDMPALLKTTTLVTLPSYYGEGVPKCLLEAAAVGRAIVTTDMPGCREAVKDGVNGVLVPPRDAKALAEAMEALLSNDALRADMGRAGRDHVQTDFEVGTVVTRTIAVYRSLGE